MHHHRAASMGSDSSYLLSGLSFLLMDQMAGTLFLVLSRAAAVGFDWQVAGITQRVLKTDKLWEK